MTLLILSVTVALGISALCSLLEATLLSFSPGQVAELSQRRPKLGIVWQSFKKSIEQPISVILICNTAAHTIGATIAGAQFEELFGTQWIVVFSLVFTFLMLQFTEILPKTIGVRYNKRIAPMVALPLAFLVIVFKPVVWLVQLINLPFERKGDKDSPEATQSEITALAGMARLSKLIGTHQERIITGAWRLSHLAVREVMIPVDQVVFLSAELSLMDAILAAHMEAHTRFPIIEGKDNNKILGYVNFKEMIYRARTNPNDHSLRGIIRPVRFVNPDEPAAALLRLFIDQHEHMAIVRDTDGKTLGLITLEDVVEELVGELEDEFDRLPRMFHHLSGDTWMVGGGMPVKELQDRLQVQLSDPYGTVSAWLLRRFGRIPRVNEVYREAGLDFTVRRIRRGNIFECSITKSRD
jgi:putative hemolysin